MNGGAETSATLTPTRRALDISGLAADSREVRPGYLFAALPGSNVEGSDYIADALDRGAVAVLAQPDVSLPAATPDIALIADANPRRRLAQMAALFYPDQPETIAAVTGTNGKTSVAAFARQIWSRLGKSAASLGTLGIEAPGLSKSRPLTTPDPVALHRDLAELAAAGVECLALEASSHGLDQYRLDGVRVRAAGFTNLSRDHLDYHGTEDAYRAAKMRLFDELMAPGGGAVLNADSAEHAALASLCKKRRHRILEYGFAAGPDHIRIEALVPGVDGLALELRVMGQRERVELPLAGAFQAMNALCALGLVLACGGEREAAVAALGGLEGARGRLERVAEYPERGAIYVDYAHTPDALATVLDALRPHVEGRLWVVFGAGGDRDRGKRPIMGGIAARLADVAIVTDDNPRGEDAAAIRRQIMTGCPEAREVGDRAEAIAGAIAGMAAGDVLVIAGKGHESGQIVGDRVIPFDDGETARRAVADLGAAP